MSPLSYLSLLCFVGSAWASQSDSLVPRAGVKNCINLKIMALGASVAFGYGSSTGDGFREPLQNLILEGGHNAVFVGTRTSGTMPDPLVEAYPGYTVEKVNNVSRTSGSYDYQPNVVMIHVGTNDCNLEYDIPNFGNRMGALVTNLTTGIPNSVIVVSTLIMNLVPRVETCILDINNQLRNEVSKLASKGHKVILADMHPAVPASDIHTDDGTHPDDVGYAKMAQVWYEALGNGTALLSSPSAKGKHINFMQTTNSSSGCAVASSSSAGSTPTSTSASSSTHKSSAASLIAGNVMGDDGKNWLYMHAASSIFVVAVAFWTFG